MMDWLASLGKEMGEQYIKSTVMDMLTPDQQAMLQSGMPLSQVAPGLQEYIAQQEAQKEAMMNQPMFRAQGGPIYMQGGMLSGYQGKPRGFSNIGKSYDPYSYVYEPSVPEETIQESASIPMVCPVGTMPDPSTGQCVSVSSSSGFNPNENRGGYGQAPTNEYQAYVDKNQIAPLNDGSFANDNYYGDNAGGRNPFSGKEYKPTYNFNPKAFTSNYDNQSWTYDKERGVATPRDRGLGDAIVDAATMMPGVGMLAAVTGAGGWHDNAEAAIRGDETKNMPQRIVENVGKSLMSTKGKVQSFLEDPLEGVNSFYEKALNRAPLNPEDIPVEERSIKSDALIAQERIQEEAKKFREKQEQLRDTAIAKREAAEEQRKAEEAKRKAEEEAKRAADIKAATINRNTNAILNSGGNSYNWGSASSDSRQSSKLDSGTGSGIGSGGGNASRGFSTGGW